MGGIERYYISWIGEADISFFPDISAHVSAKYRRSDPASTAELTREGAEARCASLNVTPRAGEGDPLKAPPEA